MEEEYNTSSEATFLCFHCPRSWQQHCWLQFNIQSLFEWNCPLDICVKTDVDFRKYCGWGDVVCSTACGHDVRKYCGWGDLVYSTVCLLVVRNYREWGDLLLSPVLSEGCDSLTGSPSLSSAANCHRRYCIWQQEAPFLHLPHCSDQALLGDVVCGWSNKWIPCWNLLPRTYISDLLFCL